MRGLLPSFVLCAMSLAFSEQARAQETELLLLNYRAPTDCPRAGDFRREVETILESPDDAPRGIPVVVVISPNPGAGYSLALSLPSGTRALEGNECQDVVRAAALFVALLLEDSALQKNPVPERVSDPPPPSLPPPPSKPAPPSGLYLGADGGVDTGTSPQIGATSSLRVGLRLNRFSLEALGLVGFPQRTELDSERSLRTAWTAGGLRVCPHLGSSSVVLLSICAGLSAGVLLTRSPELAAPQAAAPGFLSIESEARLWLLVSPRLAFALSSEFAVPLLRPVVTIDGPGPPTMAHRMESSFRASLGPRLFF